MSNFLPLPLSTISYPRSRSHEPSRSDFLSFFLLPRFSPMKRFAANDDDSVVVGLDEAEKEGRAPSTVPERFQRLFKEAPDPPLRWPWFVVIDIGLAACPQCSTHSSFESLLSPMECAEKKTHGLLILVVLFVQMSNKLVEKEEKQTNCTYSDVFKLAACPQCSTHSSFESLLSPMECAEKKTKGLLILVVSVAQMSNKLVEKEEEQTNCTSKQERCKMMLLLFSLPKLNASKV